MLIKTTLSKVICLIAAENLNLLIPAQAPVLSYVALLYSPTAFFRTHKGPEIWTHTQMPINVYILFVTSSLFMTCLHKTQTLPPSLLIYLSFYTHIQP